MREYSGVIKWKYGLHMRPASELAKICMSYNCQIKVNYGDSCVDAKSLLGLAMLAVPCNGVVKFSVDGDDEDKAIADITEFLMRDYD